METFFSYVNLITSGLIVYLAIKFRHLTFEQNFLERVGGNLVVIFCAAVFVKAMYMLSIDAFRSDPYGILFRVGYLIMYIGEIKSAMRHGVSIAMKQPHSDLMLVTKM